MKMVLTKKPCATFECMLMILYKLIGYQNTRNTSPLPQNGTTCNLKFLATDLGRERISSFPQTFFEAFLSRLHLLPQTDGGVGGHAPPSTPRLARTPATVDLPVLYDVCSCRYSP